MKIQPMSSHELYHDLIGQMTNFKTVVTSNSEVSMEYVNSIIWPI